MPVNRLFYPTVVFLFVVSAGFSQTRITSPYSRFGLGDLSDNNNAWNLAMGQIGYAVRSPFHVNYSNPASYTAFDSLSFMFEGGFNVDLVRMTSNVQTVSRNYASLGYILFGMPVTKWWKTSIGLVPYSDVGYNIVSEEWKAEIGNVNYLYLGSGGINRFFWGNGFKPFRFLSIGFNFSYLFGDMRRETVVLFPDSLYFVNFKIVNDVTMNDICFNYGIQYHTRLKENLILTAGAVFTAQSNMNAQADYVAYTFFLGSGGIEYPRDTVASGEGHKGKIVIPMMIGGGIGLEQKDKWMVGADFHWQNWKKYTAFGLSDSLVNSYQISVGTEMVPDADNYSNYLKRIRYRLGFFYQNTYLELRDKQLKEYALTLGFGFPLRGIKTAINLSAQAGIRGTTEADLIRETYFRFILGFSISERWFVKRKYY
jgi:hypothetical protein